ncbi:MAG: winged helix DNA-binding domain-containing protein, partial [Chloroflexaceae bacterium]|nr:winged helix DNA-binding domain-containing protein [Chloroflexaceae bacterium]
MLLTRDSRSVLAAVEHLVGLQSQVPNPPYIGLWTRLAAFARPNLTDLIMQAQVVRAPLLRSTLHLVTAPDLLRLYNTIQPALIRAFGAFFWHAGQ